MTMTEWEVGMVPLCRFGFDMIGPGRGLRKGQQFGRQMQWK